MLVLGNTSPSNAAVDDFVLTRTFFFSSVLLISTFGGFLAFTFDQLVKNYQSVFLVLRFSEDDAC